MSDPDPYLTTNEVAVLFGVTPETIRDYIKEGRIKAIQLKRQWRIRTSECERLANETYGGPNEPTA